MADVLRCLPRQRPPRCGAAVVPFAEARRGTIEKQLDNQIRHIDSLEPKAGILRGFLAVTLATAAGTKDFAEAAKSYNTLKVAVAAIFTRMCWRTSCTQYGTRTNQHQHPRHHG